MTEDIKKQFEAMEFNPTTDGFLAATYKQLGRVAVFRVVPTYEQLGVVNDPALKKLGVANVDLKKQYEGFEYNDCDRMLRFVIMFCDPQSPFSEEKDLEERIKVCFSTLKLNKQSPVVKEVMEQGDLFRNYLFEYFKKIHSIEYEAWLSMKIAYHNFCKIIRTNINSTTSEQATNQIRQISKDLKDIKANLLDIEYKLFQDKRILNLIKDAAIEESVGGYAEMNAESLNEWLQNG